MIVYRQIRHLGNPVLGAKWPFFTEMLVKHKAEALAIHCIDLRFQAQIDEDLQNRGLKDKFDRISWPGASKDLESVTKAAEVSIRLHDPDQALIYEHEDCGAYGEDNSEETHRQNANNLANSLKKIKPSLKVSTLIATFDGIKEL